MDKYIAMIPVRGGSKSIPLKNIMPINGRPLVYWGIDAAIGCDKIGKVYVCTDDDRIRKAIDEYIKQYDCADRLFCVGRPDETATDTAPTALVVDYFIEQYNQFEHLILIQATSPLITSQDLSNGIEEYEQSGADSLVTVVRQKRFNWSKSDVGYQPLNYDLENRPRRQDFDGYLVENGAFYIYRGGKYPLSGHIAAYEMCDETYFEIDDPSDWIIVEGLLKHRDSIK